MRINFARKEDIVLIPIGYFVLILYLYLYVPEVSPKLEKIFTILTVIPIAVIALAQERIKSWWFPAELKIDFALKEPGCSKSPFHVSYKIDNPMVPGSVEDKRFDTEAYYFRLVVKNIGFTSAKQCEVILLPLSIINEGEVKIVKYSQPANLKWDMHDKERYLDVNPSPVGEYVRFGYISKGYQPSQCNLESLFTIGGYQPTFLKKGNKYQFTILVGGSNAKYVKKTYQFLWNGVWKDNEDEMFNEIEFKEVL